MAHWSLRQIFVFMLAVLVTAGLSLSAVQAASAMPQTAKMSMMDGMGMSGDNACKQCGTDIGGAKATVCSSMACVGALAANEQPALGMVLTSGAIFTAAEAWLSGRSFAPEPYPPRPFHIV